ncbi:MAG TPA: DUF1501 domain-containing protein [Verrucomicrobiae bacterium]|nr:DUF1501 domain-containing protein [Verrucomicrobiae bacterium]
MNPIHERLQQMSRRHFFKSTGLAAGRIALAGMMLPELARATTKDKAVALAHPPLPGLPHFAPKAKRLIYLFMNGGPSQMDLMDYKPGLEKIYDTDLPDSIRQGQRLTTMTSGQKRFPIAPSKYSFKQYGQSGMWFSELLPHTAKIADDIAVIKSVHTEAINHDPAVTFIQTGNQIPGKPSLGSWLSYGLGSECNNLPAFVVMTPRWSAKRDAQALYQRLWEAGFLPTKHAGVALRAQGDPVLYLNDPPGVDSAGRRNMLDALAKLNQAEYKRIGDPEINTRISQYEMAFRMQSSVPDLINIAGEEKATLDLYGPEVTTPGTFAHSAIMARRLAERGVRCIEIFHREWDHHGDLERDLPLQCRDVDQACYGLITDLKNRGMLDETLVVWGGEFGRTVYCQGKLTRESYGRDHHPRCFTMWMAGGGVKGGTIYGETDDFSYNVVRDPVHIRDINATILHCLGIDHRLLTYKFQGLDQRLTGVEEANPVTGILV